MSDTDIAVDLQRHLLSLLSKYFKRLGVQLQGGGGIRVLPQLCLLQDRAVIIQLAILLHQLLRLKQVLVGS